jgi:hypothetical protein
VALHLMVGRVFISSSSINSQVLRLVLVVCCVVARGFRRFASHGPVFVSSSLTSSQGLRLVLAVRGVVI